MAAQGHALRGLVQPRLVEEEESNDRQADERDGQEVRQAC
jgi:hypothetical protein